MSTAVLCYEGPDGNPVAVSATNPLPLAGAISDAALGQPNGVATLDASGKVPASQLPVGDVTYLGNWNATTNTPTLADGVGAAGDLYICDVAGTQNLGGGSVAYAVGDWLIYDGTVWDRVPAANATPANPSATVGLTAKNGTAVTFMRSDAAPALDQSIAPTWTGLHTFDKVTTVVQGGGNGIALTPVASGNSPSIAAVGANADISLNIAPKGNAAIGLQGPTVVTGNLTTTATLTVGGNANVAGNLGSAANVNPPGPTNSGIVIGGAPTWAMQSMYDQAQSANNRTADFLWISGALKWRFANDARNAFLDVLSINGGQATGVTGITSTSGSGSWAHTGSMTVSGSLTANGAIVRGVVASGGANAQSGNINQPSFYAVPTSGMYRVSATAVVTRAATTSSVLPGINVQYTEATTGVAVGDIVTTTANTNQVGLHTGGSVIINAQQGANIGYSTTNYDSSGATSMQYTMSIKVEFLG
jgi:hypothetical protein